MQLNEKIKNLKSFDIFSELTYQQISVIAQFVKEKEFEPKTVFIEQEARADVAYFIYDGSVKVYRITQDGNEINLSIVGAGEVVGEMALLDEKPRSAYVETIQKTKALSISQEQFKRILVNHPKIAFSLILILSKRVRKLSEFVEEVVSQKLPERTWHALQVLSKYFPGGQITLSHEEISQIIGATRARVTEILNDFEHQGKIELSHKNIKILGSE